MVGRLIAVRDDMDPGVEALAIAHELAHTINEKWGLIRGSDATVEYQMDATAAAVLAPQSDVARALASHANAQRMRCLFGYLPICWIASRLSLWIDAVIGHDFFC